LDQGINNFDFDSNKFRQENAVILQLFDLIETSGDYEEEEDWEDYDDRLH
jgi:hypothetical protein